MIFQELSLREILRLKKVYVDMDSIFKLGTTKISSNINFGSPLPKKKFETGEVFTVT